VAAAVDQFRPDALVVDQQAVAGALVANARGLPWATSATPRPGWSIRWPACPGSGSG